MIKVTIGNGRKSLMLSPGVEANLLGQDARVERSHSAIEHHQLVAIARSIVAYSL